MQEHSEANQRWQFEKFRQSNSYSELLGIDGESIEFELNISPGLASLEIFQMIQKNLQDQNIEPENFEDRIIFMSMFNDIEWTKKGNLRKMYFKFGKSQELSGEILARTLWTFFGPGDEKKWYGTLSFSPEGK